MTTAGAADDRDVGAQMVDDQGNKPEYTESAKYGTEDVRDANDSGLTRRSEVVSMSMHRPVVDNDFLITCRHLHRLLHGLLHRLHGLLRRHRV